MPELPDLEIFRENLTEKVCGKTISAAGILNPLKVAALREDVASLVGDKTIDIKRVGKELHFLSDSGKTFGVHLMLSGKFNYCKTSESTSIRFGIFSLGFEDNNSLIISDYQSMCKVTFEPHITDVPDALGETFTEDYFNNAIFKNRRKNIKALLIDQGIIKGIGNAYADEILWQAKISPESVAGKIPPEKLGELYRAISIVLVDAIGKIKLISPDIIGGEERSFLNVHNSKKKFTDDGEVIRIAQIASKKTYYTDSQQMYI